jgi:hypothetical protein
VTNFLRGAALGKAFLQTSGGVFASMAAIFGADSKALWVFDADKVTLRDAGGGSVFVTGVTDLINGFTLSESVEANQPVWEATGWNGKGCMRSADTSDRLTTTAAGLMSVVNGDDLPFSLLCLYQVVSGTFARRVIGWAGTTTTGLWQNTGATSELFLRLNGTSLGVGTTQDTGRHVYGWARKTGDVSTAHRDATKILDNGAHATGAISGNTSFSIGDVGAANSGAFRLRMAMVVGRAYTDSEYAAWRALALEDSPL